MNVRRVGMIVGAAQLPERNPENEFPHASRRGCQRDGAPSAQPVRL